MIHDAQMDYYGKRLATCSSDKTIKIFEVPTKGAPVESATLVGHDGPVWQVSWAHPKWGSILASCSYDRKVVVWKEDKPKQWQKLYEYTGHELSVNSIAWGPQELGLTLATASSDGHISVLSWTAGSKWEVVKVLAHASGVNAVSWAPSVTPGSLLVQTKEITPRLVSGGCDNLVKIWTRGANNEWVNEKLPAVHTDWVRDVAWAPSIGLPNHTIASCSQDHKVVVWTGIQEGVKLEWSHVVIPHDAPVWRVSWSITGNILAVSLGDNKLVLWKETDKKWVQVTEMSEAEPAPQQQ